MEQQSGERETLDLTNIKSEVNTQLADDDVKRALLATTFNGLDELNMKKAMFEGMMRGFTIKDFLNKDIYAVPFNTLKGPSYSLVESIGHCRKIGARSGVVGKSAPTYTHTEDGSIETCSVTVYKKGGHPDGYTATVYFDEYKSNKTIWRQKPRTMIAKVAEMHALRMACPEELSESYIEEEFDKEPRIADVKEVDSASLHMGSFDKDHDKKDSEKSDEPSDEEKARILEEEKRESQENAEGGDEQKAAR